MQKHSGFFKRAGAQLKPDVPDVHWDLEPQSQPLVKELRTWKI